MAKSRSGKIGVGSVCALQGVLTAAGVAAGLFLLNVWPTTRPPRADLPSSKDILALQAEQRLYETERTISLDMPAIDRPPTDPSSEARLADDESVIGVSSGGQSRALLAARAGAKSGKSHRQRRNRRRAGQRHLLRPPGLRARVHRGRARCAGAASGRPVSGQNGAAGGRTRLPTGIVVGTRAEWGGRLPVQELCLCEDDVGDVAEGASDDGHLLGEAQGLAVRLLAWIAHGVVEGGASRTFEAVLGQQFRPVQRLQIRTDEQDSLFNPVDHRLATDPAHLRGGPHRLRCRPAGRPRPGPCLAIACPLRGGGE